MIKSIYEERPENGKEYFVELHHNQLDEISYKKLIYKENKWQIEDEDLKVALWEYSSPHSKEWDMEWINFNLDKIKEAFGYDSLLSSELCIATGLLECLADYDWFYLNDFVRLVDNVYVIRVL